MNGAVILSFSHSASVWRQCLLCAIKASSGLLMLTNYGFIKPAYSETKISLKLGKETQGNRKIIVNCKCLNQNNWIIWVTKIFVLVKTHIKRLKYSIMLLLLFITLTWKYQKCCWVALCTFINIIRWCWYLV